MRDVAEKLVKDAIAAAVDAGELALDALPDDVGIERPKDPSHGDWASSAALRLAKAAHMPPREIAEKIAAHMQADPAIASVEVAGPGFVNLRLSNAALQQVFADVRARGADFGRGHAGEGVRVDLEFISANPTGPMHLGHGRWAALGDAMARVLEFAGYDVTREFYINDAGSQMDKFAASVVARYLQVARLAQEAGSVEQAVAQIMEHAKEYRAELPEDAYGGAYVVDIAARIYADEGGAWVDADADAREAHFKETAYTAVLAHVKEVLEGFGLHFDVWFSERSLHEVGEDGTSAISRVVAELDERGYLERREGAVFFKTTEFGDDKDRVLVKADGAYTYFAPDIAYHKDKLDRGFTRCIDLLGADHHGYIKRIQSVGQVFGHPGQPEVVIGQLVNLLRDGSPVRMSKRTGEMVTFEELLDEVGADATRFSMLARSTDQAIDFDIAQAKRQDSTNPVYYVQYAHARICSILRRAAETDDVDADVDALAAKAVGAAPDLSVLHEPAELDVARKIGEFAECAAGCARDLAPFRLTHYAYELASTFTTFYTRCHVLDEPDDVRRARLAVCDATRIVLATTLGLLGVSAPTHM